MSVAEVFLRGTRIGAVQQNDVASVPIFNYDPLFLNSGIEVSSLVMPLNRRTSSCPAVAEETFHGRPGVLADSLPDKYGTRLIEKYLSEQGRNLSSLTAVERLLYTGKRGMGALEYVPTSDYASVEDTSIQLSALVELASEILSAREGVHITDSDHVMEQIINVGTSAGGARAKAVVAWNPESGDIRSGQIEAGKGYTYWLIKFDGVKNNKDKGEKADGVSYTRIEYAYYLMAQEAGIDMNECRLYQEDGYYHFMTKRFDRNDMGEKLHMQSLGALAHYDYNMPGAYSYEQAYDVMNRIGLGQKAAGQMFRRMVFNVLARNQDDHVKNISFLMDKSGRWFLAPAYDITYANDAGNRWVARHQMCVNGKTENITGEDMTACGRRMNLSKARVNRVIEEVKLALDSWSRCAEKSFLREEDMEYIKKQFVLL
ncbi:MAG: type II toxin-antitoxin system HipA family toxin [Lachnospiraceae bacterium]|nr:type II toxin-antitoxin system HipA family toxin [Lachnospiraceae bacterium]